MQSAHEGSRKYTTKNDAICYNKCPNRSQDRVGYNEKQCILSYDCYFPNQVPLPARGGRVIGRRGRVSRRCADATPVNLGFFALLEVIPKADCSVGPKDLSGSLIPADTMSGTLAAVHSLGCLIMFMRTFSVFWWS